MLQGGTETVKVELKMNKMLWLGFPWRETLDKAGVKKPTGVFV